MLGNDVVDLAEADEKSNWKRKGFLDKLFNEEEQGEILSSINPTNQLWLFWSMKEAVYKIVNRATKNRFFSPLKFNCYLAAANEGIVYYEDICFYTKTKSTNNYIHTIATRDLFIFDEIQIRFYQNNANYIKRYNDLSLNFRFEKDNFGIPKLIERNTQTEHITSVSHHGKYLAMVYL